MSATKKITTFLLAFYFCIGAQAQEESATSKKIIVYVTKQEPSKLLLQEFLQENKGVIYRTNQDMNEYDAEFDVDINIVKELDSLADQMGYVVQSTFNTENYEEKIISSRRQLDDLNTDNESLHKEMMDSLVYAKEDREQIRQKILENNRTINFLQSSIREYEEKKIRSNKCRVYFTIRDEMSTPNNSRISFVNMPGVEYGYLITENPKSDVSAKAYQGLLIKYMFTRGKSYFNLGVYKAVDNNKLDSTMINEMFMINFGQDFYPKHFGRGKRKFLNLYTGYQIGGFITNHNNDRNNVFIANVNIALGVELIKTKHILVDNKVSYFLPLNEDNRNLRGVLYNFSFNFVF